MNDDRSSDAPELQSRPESGAEARPESGSRPEPRSRRGLRLRDALILAAVLAASTWWFHFRAPAQAESTDGAIVAQPAGGAERPAAAPKPALTVRAVSPQPGEWPVRLAADGSIAAWQEVSISPEVGGLRIAEVLVNVGDTVRKGQTLAVLSAASVDFDLAAQNAALAEARAGLAEAQANAERSRRLARSGAISAQQIEQYETAFRTAQARVQAAQARIRAGQLRVSQTRVVASDDGVIAVRPATVGAVAQAGQELFRMIRHGRLEWRAQVPAADLSRIAAGQPVSLRLPDGQSVSGTVRTVAPTVDPQTRNGLVYVDLAPLGPAAASPAAAGSAAPASAAAAPAAATSRPAPLVLPGMFARGEIDLGRSAVLTLPATSVLLREGFAYVFRLDAEGRRVAAVKVLTGRRQGDRIEIVDGLPPEARVVERGVGFLADGDAVTVES